MTDQLSFLVPQPAPSPGLPPAAAKILHAARSMSFSTRIVRGHWGIGIGPKRKWMLMGDCCCALAALLVVEGAQAEEGDNSASPSVARALGISAQEVYQFIDGFDGEKPDDGSPWFGYGRRVAQELKVSG